MLAASKEEQQQLQQVVEHWKKMFYARDKQISRLKSEQVLEKCKWFMLLYATLTIDSIDYRTQDWKQSNNCPFTRTLHITWDRWSIFVTVPRLAVAMIQVLVASFNNSVLLHKPYHAIYDYVYFTKM